MSKRSKPSAAVKDKVTLAGFRASLAGWVSALQAHRMAPPDPGFSARLAGLAAAADEQARVYRAAAADYEWVPYSAGQPPYELRPDTGRRGPQSLWQHFDAAVAQLGAASESEDMDRGRGGLRGPGGAAAAKLAQAMEREARASSRPPRPRRRRRAA